MKNKKLKEALNNLNSMVDDLPCVRLSSIDLDPITFLEKPREKKRKEWKIQNNNSSEFLVDLKVKKSPSMNLIANGTTLILLIATGTALTLLITFFRINFVFLKPKLNFALLKFNFGFKKTKFSD